MLKRMRYLLIMVVLSVGGLTGCDQIVNYFNQNCTTGEGSISCGSGD